MLSLISPFKIGAKRRGYSLSEDHEATKFPPQDLATFLSSAQGRVLAALQLLASPEGLKIRQILQANLSHFNAQRLIIPKIIGGNQAALDAARSLLEQGFLIPVIRYPTVPGNTACLRITVLAAPRSHQGSSKSPPPVGRAP